MNRVIVSALLVLVSRVHPAAAQEPVPTDSLMQSYMRGLADSTDAWYGATVAPLDTTGLDSALVAGLAAGPQGGRRGPRRNPVSLSNTPALGFNRADGGQLGVSSTLSLPRGVRVAGRLQYTTGTHDWLGDGKLMRSFRVPNVPGRLEWSAAAGRWTEPFDRDFYSPTLVTIAALTTGSDRHDYLRRDGFRSALAWVGRDAMASLEWRDQLESALPFTTDWTLFGGDPELLTNAQAFTARVRELGLAAHGRIPGTRFNVGGRYWTSGSATGSDLIYRRLRLEAGGDVSLGRHFALVTQSTYGRLRGQAVPQDAFFLGGVHSLRTLERNEFTGTGHAFARADVVLVDDLPRLLHLPVPAWLPLQASVFAASGALWGTSGTGHTALETRRDLPRASEWRSEAGAGLAWRPGIPNPQTLIRFEYAWPIGPDAREPKFTFAIQRYLDLVPLLKD
ncbi:MAG: outer membrane protein assembly factor [Candidatus Eisenbacteria bacterium]|nr:outer membrane protein assembly factor [Candidatus Eisenbacteria bacterium]